MSLELVLATVCGDRINTEVTEKAPRTRREKNLTRFDLQNGGILGVDE